jgi:hypothetical protein
VASLFAAFLGYNPIRTLLGPSLSHLSRARVEYLTGRSFFPHLISAPFASGLREAFSFAVVACLIAAAASWLRGAKYHHAIETVAVVVPDDAPGGSDGHSDGTPPVGSGLVDTAQRSPTRS